ncbi:MAG: VOC family protein [Caldilineaceae bacterium]|nr:VOC family protein [Caldilineaceae bacterium]
MNALELRLAMNVRDFARSVDFYETLLGMARITAWHDEGEGPGIILRIGRGRIAGTLRRTLRGTGCAAVGVVCHRHSGRRRDAWHDRLVAAGVSIARPGRQPWGDRSFGVVDPDGVRIWFNQVTDPAYAANWANASAYNCMSNAVSSAARPGIWSTSMCS